MATPSDKLTQSLAELKRLQDSGIIAELDTQGTPTQKRIYPKSYEGLVYPRST